MEKRAIDGYTAGFLLAGVFAALSTNRDLLAAGKYLTFIGTAAGAALCIALAFAIGWAAHEAYLSRCKKDYTVLNRVIFWAVFAVVVGAVVVAGFGR